MGVDAKIYFKAKDNKLPDLFLPQEARLFPVENEDWLQAECPGANYEVSTGWRYYGVGYERGPWPEICGILMLLHSCEEVETVWYGGDCFFVRENSPEEILEISAHYMKNGHRPYYS